MCGRYFIPEPDNNPALEKFIEQANRRNAGMKRSGEAFPSDTLPVVAATRRLLPAGFAMRWGYRASDGRLIINARSETARQKPLFCKDMISHRCAIPADRYFEWRHSAQKEKYAIRPASSVPFYMAGLYRMEDDMPCFVILTRQASEALEDIHSRMPVILPPDAMEAWIMPGDDGASALDTAVTDVSLQRCEALVEQLRMDF